MRHFKSKFYLYCPRMYFAIIPSEVWLDVATSFKISNFMQKKIKREMKFYLKTECLRVSLHKNRLFLFKKKDKFMEPDLRVNSPENHISNFVWVEKTIIYGHCKSAYLLKLPLLYLVHFLLSVISKTLRRDISSKVLNVFSLCKLLSRYFFQSSVSCWEELLSLSLKQADKRGNSVVKKVWLFYLDSSASEEELWSSSFSKNENYEVQNLWFEAV